MFFLDTDTIIKEIGAGYLMNSILVAFYKYAHLRFVVFLGSSRNAPPNMCPALTFCYHFYRHAKNGNIANALNNAVKSFFVI